MKGTEVCRAFTFINYHIPLIKGTGALPDYATIGFFDGLFTEPLKVDYLEEGLRGAWKYILDNSVKSEGKFSYQNILGISSDDWNNCTDIEFWSEKTNQEFPLTFVVFLQVSDYLVSEKAIGIKCRDFNEILAKEIGITEMKSYIYGSVDKNDFIICIKAKKHKKVLDAIKKMHQIDIHIVYSYSTLSINQKVLDELKVNEQYSYLYEETIDSICLKGITNSFAGMTDTFIDKKYTLDQKYCNLCDELMKRIYEGEPEEEKGESVAYDILGDNDFRLIARNVKLGKLLEQYAENEILSYTGEEFRFDLYSSSMVLNTRNQDTYSLIPQEDKSLALQEMNDKLEPKRCILLDERMEAIENMALKRVNGEVDDKVLTICRAIWQLLQSLKVLEKSPVKKYDFNSLYIPFEVLVDILEENVFSGEAGDDMQLYEFVHKFSMTLNGTLRTDIQFFRVQDFNAIVHYAPAKLRAFYSMWALEISEYYNSLSEEELAYAFIFSPGLFDRITVERLKLQSKKAESLMLITVPERSLYSMKRMAIVLTHEVSHFVGKEARKRTERYNAWCAIAARIIELEIRSIISRRGDGLLKDRGKNKRAEMTAECIYEKIRDEVWQSGRNIEMRKKSKEDMTSEETVNEIRQEYHNVDVGNMMLILFAIWEPTLKIKDNGKVQAEEVTKITKENEMIDNEIKEWFSKYQHNMLYVVLKQIEHISKEAYADIMAILTLDLEPKDYLLSFGHNRSIESVDAEEEKCSVLEIRVAIVVQAIQNLVKKHSVKGDNVFSESFCNAWKNGISKAVIKSLENDLEIYVLAAKIYDYPKSVINYAENIAEYESFYERENYVNFMNKSLCYAKDKIINDSLKEYIEVCADYYSERIIETSMLERKNKIVKVYNVISGDSIVEVMQEIENFLEDSNKENVG